MKVAAEQNDSRKMAMAQIEKALAQIELAQGLIAQASGSISRVVGLAAECSELGRLYDKLKAGWHRLNMRTAGGGFEMDTWWKRDHAMQSNPKQEGVL